MIVATTTSSASRAAAVATELRRRIFEGRYLPGTALRELTIARELNVSQATVREALQRLEYGGLVTRTANIGSAVTRLSPREIRERLELRSLLEAQVVGAASTAWSDATFARLELLVEAIEQAVAANRSADAGLAELEFFQCIWGAAGNQTVARHLELVTEPLFAFLSTLRAQSLFPLANAAEAPRGLLTALRSGDPEKTREALGKATVAPYLRFLDSTDRAALAAFGYLQATPE